MILDTHKAVERMIATGVSKEMAEVIVEVSNETNGELATKGNLELGFSKLESRISNVENNQKWLQGICVACLLMLIKLVFFV